MNKIKTLVLEDRQWSGLFIILLFLAFFSVYALKPSIGGDGFSYLDGMQVIRTGNIPEGFVPNRLLTTYLGLRSIILLSSITGNVSVAWILQNRIFYIIFGLVFYSLAKRLVDDRKAAFFATLFAVTNYSIVSFGLGYLMDMGGWAFYMVSLYFSFRYLESEDQKWMWFSSLAVGIGGMFKEYAVLGYVALFLSICVVNKKSFKYLFKNIFFSGLLSFGSVILMNIYIIKHFNYSYLSWFNHQGELYPTMNYFIEFIKSFGSLYNFGWFLFFYGVYIFILRTKEAGKSILEDKKLVFIWFVIISALPVLVWPPVTRVLFITVPALVLVTSLAIKKMQSNQWVLLPILSLYFISSYLMDGFILNFINLPF